MKLSLKIGLRPAGRALIDLRVEIAVAHARMAADLLSGAPGRYSDRSGLGIAPEARHLRPTEHLHAIDVEEVHVRRCPLVRVGNVVDVDADGGRADEGTRQPTPWLTTRLGT